MTQRDVETVTLVCGIRSGIDNRVNVDDEDFDTKMETLSSNMIIVNIT